MQLVFFVLIYPLLWLVSILPFRLLYLFSDFLYVIIYRIIGYRKTTVRANLALAFPYKSDAERLDIEKKSYHHLCDMFLEMIKTMSLSEVEMNKRFKFTNLEMFKDLEKKNKSIVLMCAHYASYEWVISMNKHINFQGYAIYKKIANKYFDKLVRDIRSKFKAELITTKETIPTIQSNQAKGFLSVYGFASDQSPKAAKTFHYTNFLGLHSGVSTGAEMLAKRFDMNVIFLKVTKIKRGFYEATFEMLSENATEAKDYEITDAYIGKVEKQILAAPEFYLWTHKRWKNIITT